MRECLVLAVFELYAEMGGLLREAQSRLSPEAFQRMISESGISGRVANGSMRLSRDVDRLICR
jgi:hypothetical protein